LGLELEMKLRRIAKTALACGMVLALAGSSAGMSGPRKAAELGPRLDAAVAEAMKRTGARGLAIAVIDGGQPVLVKAWGERNAAGDPLGTDTILYGASLTKTAFAYMVMQLVDQGAARARPADRLLSGDAPARIWQCRRLRPLG
jgi:CubicO group peptidase (beta-lactamase class C family)